LAKLSLSKGDLCVKIVDKFTGRFHPQAINSAEWERLTGFQVCNKLFFKIKTLFSTDFTNVVVIIFKKIYL